MIYVCDADGIVYMLCTLLIIEVLQPLKSVNRPYFFLSTEGHSKPIPWVSYIQ